MNLKSIIVRISRLSDEQLICASAEAEHKSKDYRLNEKEINYWHAFHLLALNAISEREWKRKQNAGLQTSNDSA